MGDNKAIEDTSSVAEDRATRRRIRQRENRKQKRELARMAKNETLSNSNVILKPSQPKTSPFTTKTRQNSNSIQESGVTALEETKQFLTRIYENDALARSGIVLQGLKCIFNDLGYSSTWGDVRFAWSRLSSFRFDSIDEMETLVKLREEEADLYQMHASRVPELLDSINDGHEDRDAIEYGAVVLLAILPLIETQRVYMGVQLGIAQRRNEEYQELRELEFRHMVDWAMIAPEGYYTDCYDKRWDLAERLGVSESRLEGVFLERRVADARHKLQEALGNRRDEDWVGNKHLI